LKYNLIKTKESGARVGELITAHGKVNTPFFMPVGTVGSVKGVSPSELNDLGAQIVLSNTYHLYLRPGEQLIKKLGGLHEFMRWEGPILTDSGGYQVFSLNENKFKSKNLKFKNKEGKSLVKITEDGVEFTSHLDGSKHFFTPEKVVEIQLDLGVDILMPLDVCPSGKASKEEVKEAVELTIKWAKRAKRHFDKRISNSKIKSNNCNFKSNNLGIQKQSDFSKLEANSQKLTANLPALFGIVQGGLDAYLRKYCAEELIKLNFDGYAVGGLAVDHETRDMWQTVKQMGEILPANKPRYLMGVGTPNDIAQAMSLGMDMFDCVLPTRLARHGSVFVYKNGISKSEYLPLRSMSYEGQVISNQISNNKSKIQKYNETTSSKKLDYTSYKLINLLNSKYRTDPKVIEEGCECPACKGGFSRAYISHLIRNNEMIGLRLATLHNLKKYLDLVKNI
jgi:queuine tRNA-ribosyltransferase